MWLCMLLTLPCSDMMHSLSMKLPCASIQGSMSLWVGFLTDPACGAVGANLLMLMRVNWQSEVDKALAKQSKK